MKRVITFIVNPNLAGEALDKNGDEKVKQYVVTEGHERDEVKRCPSRCTSHPIV